MRAGAAPPAGAQCPVRAAAGGPGGRRGPLRASRGQWRPGRERGWRGRDLARTLGGRGAQRKCGKRAGSEKARKGAGEGPGPASPKAQSPDKGKPRAEPGKDRRAAQSTRPTPTPPLTATRRTGVRTSPPARVRRARRKSARRAPAVCIPGCVQPRGVPQSWELLALSS